MLRIYGLVTGLFLSSFLLVNPAPAIKASEFTPLKLDGKEVFLKHKCNDCHAVSTAGITAKKKTKAPDLVDVTVRHEKDWIRRYIRQNDVHVSCPKVDKARDGKKHIKKFTGTKEEEDALIEWLDKQRSK